MPWSNQSGGGSGGGPRKPINGPWGQGPSGGRGGPNTPDIEEFLRRLQERVRGMLPGGAFTGRGIAIVVLVVVVVWALSGFYTVLPNEVGLNFTFGRYTGNTPPGLNYNYPTPIGSHEKLPVTDRKSIDIGGALQDVSQSTIATTSERQEESLMLTSDENIVDLRFRVVYQIDPATPQDYAFNVQSPEDVVRAVGESAMREVAGHTPIQELLTKREAIAPIAQDLMQNVLTSYKAGVRIVQVQLLSVGPPPPVINSFLDVTAAQQELQQNRNEGEKYANQKVPEAKGKAARIKQDAEGYKLQKIAEAKGLVSRFDQVYEAYKKAPTVTRQRLYIETMERVLQGADKIILDEKGAGSGVIPYLPLGDLGRKSSSGMTR